MPPGCAPVGGFAVGARVALLWQHNANLVTSTTGATTEGSGGMGSEPQKFGWTTPTFLTTKSAITVT